MAQIYSGNAGTFSFLEVETKGEKEYYISGYISTKAIDTFNDLVTDECMSDMLEQINSGSIKIDYEHETIHSENLDINPVARIVEAKKDEKGIWVKAMINSSNKRFGEMWGSIKNGFLDSFSIAFKPIETATRYIQGKAIRLLNKLKLVNIGITGTPVNSECKLDNIIVKAISELNENMSGYIKLDELSDEELELKHKYIKRTGSPGHYEYFYRDGSSSKSPKGESNNKEKISGDAVYDTYGEDFNTEDWHVDSTYDSLEKAEERQNQIVDEVESGKEKPYTMMNILKEKQDGKTIYKIVKKDIKPKESKEFIEDEAEALKQAFMESMESGKIFNVNTWKKNREKNRPKKESNSVEQKSLDEPNDNSHSTEQSDDNKQMAEEENQIANEANEVKTTETETTETTEVKTEVEEVKVKEVKTDNADLEKELDERNKELAEVKAKMVELEKQLAKPEFKALQDTPITKLKENNVTPLGLIG